MTATLIIAVTACAPMAPAHDSTAPRSEDAANSAKSSKDDPTAPRREDAADSAKSSNWVDYGVVGPLGPKVDLRPKLAAAMPLPGDDDPSVQTHHVQLRCVKDHATVNVYWTTVSRPSGPVILSVWSKIQRIAPNNKLTVDSVEFDNANNVVASYALWYGTANVSYSAVLHPDGTAKRDVATCP